jgi:glutamate-ammonia-ligase adenylyltransferase
MDIRDLLNPKTKPQEALDELSGHGFMEPHKALDNLRLLAEGVEDPSLLALLTSLISACSASADPDLCLNNFEHVSAAFENRGAFLGMISSQPESVKLLAPLFASSRFLVRHIVPEPEETLSWLLAPGRLDGPRDRESVVRELMKLVPKDAPLPDAMRILRWYKYREFLRITVRDLLGRSDIPQTTLELSNLADAALSAAVRVAAFELDRKYGQPLYEKPTGRTARSPFTVIAMGKLGGRELNFSSDIDIMYLYLADGTTAGPVKVTNHQYFVKLGELITKLIGDKTEDGFVFRVDLRLRPEGERGDLAQSLTGYEVYYESWGQTWERSALIKARPCAGDMELGRDFLEMIRPFVFRKYLDYAAIGEIRDMKRRIEKAGAPGKREIDLKLGVGGIREIEFFISALQLINGGRDASIREKNSLKALHRLALVGLVTFEEQGELTRAYEFLRLAEHRLQVVDERQIHSFLADDKIETRALGMRMGWRDTKDVDAGEAFMRELKYRTGRVRAVYDGLFAEQAVDVTSADEGYDAVLSVEAAETDVARALAEKGFRSPQQACRDMLLLRDGSPSSPLTPRSRNLFIKILPALLAGCASSPDPDMALSNLESFIAAFGSREAIYDLITEKPQAASRITRLFGSSEYLSRLLVAHPEMSDALLFAGEEGLKKEKEQMAAELAAEMRGTAEFADKMDILRRFKHAEELRIGIRDVFTGPGYRAISSDLTALAEVVLDGALGMAGQDMEARYGLPRGLASGEGIAVAGFGKLGAGELGYGSDLDIIFINDKAGKTTGERTIGGQEFFARLSERVIFAISSLTKDGSVFRVDTRLRPGGSKGVLAHTLDGLEKYYAKSASVWELQALTRARAVAGDLQLCSGFESVRLKILAQPRDGAALKAEVRAMRARTERELGRMKKSGYHIKHGKGGITDVEFAVQYLQLLHGHEHPELLVAGTYAALEVIISLKLMPGVDGARLKEAYEFLRELESRLRITSSQAESVLPQDESELAVIAARMGYSGKGPEAAKALMDDYLSHAGRVREIFERVLK